jgi:hypothetical protein
MTIIVFKKENPTVVCRKELEWGNVKTREAREKEATRNTTRGKKKA